MSLPGFRRIGISLGRILFSSTSFQFVQRAELDLAVNQWTIRVGFIGVCSV
jgi:hypothetical protein